MKIKTRVVVIIVTLCIGVYIFLTLYTTSAKDLLQKHNIVNHIDCPAHRRPKLSEIQFHKDVYQKLEIPLLEGKNTDIFALYFYFDDRFQKETGERHIRTFISLAGPGQWAGPVDSPDVLKWIQALHKFKWSVLLWYKELTEPITSTCWIQGAGGLTKNVSNTYFYQEVLTCTIPEIGLLPEYASITNGICATPNGLFSIVYPEYNTNDEKIGVCTASLYGEMTDQNLTYFVNWLEALQLFGISSVTVNNATLQLKGEYIQRMFNYYKGKGFLQVTNYPPVHTSWFSPDEDDSVTEGINKLTTGDCIYRNLHNFWYVLIIDTDELPVPIKVNTYQDHLHNLLTQQPNWTDYHSLSIRSAFFLQDQTIGNPEYGQHLPIFRLTNRFRTEPLDNGVGLAKSFHNMRNVVSTGHHFARQTHFGGGPKNIRQMFMSDDDILIHHYRDSCKYLEYCESYWNHTIHEDIIPRKYGSTLQARIEQVLEAIQYPLV